MMEQPKLLAALPVSDRWKSRLVRGWRAVPLVLTLTLVWLIMNEHINWLLLISGLVVAIGTLAVTRIVIHRSYVDELWLGWRATLVLFPFMLKQIALSAVSMAKAIIKGDAESVSFSFQSILHDDLSIFLLCTFIILTPGSIVIQRNDGLLRIVCIGSDTRQARKSCEELELKIAGLLHTDEGLRARSGRIAESRRAAKLRDEARARALASKAESGMEDNH